MLSCSPAVLFFEASLVLVLVLRVQAENGKWKMENETWKMENGKWTCRSWSMARPYQARPPRQVEADR